MAKSHRCQHGREIPVIAGRFSVPNAMVNSIIALVSRIDVKLCEVQVMIFV